MGLTSTLVGCEVVPCEVDVCQLEGGTKSLHDLCAVCWGMELVLVLLVGGARLLCYCLCHLEGHRAGASPLEGRVLSTHSSHIWSG